MAKLNIPERFRVGLSRLRALDESSVLQIRSAPAPPVLIQPSESRCAQRVTGTTRDLLFACVEDPQAFGDCSRQRAASSEVASCATRHFIQP